MTHIPHRHHVYEKFKRGDIKTLFLTRIGNEGVDLPNARVIIIASGQGTSETEDAQRFGRALRGVEESKDNRFLYEVYTDTNSVVHLSDDLNREKIYAEKRETFLRNRGYTIRDEIVQDNEIIYIIGHGYVLYDANQKSVNKLDSIGLERCLDMQKSV